MPTQDQSVDRATPRMNVVNSLMCDFCKPPPDSHWFASVVQEYTKHKH